MIDITSAVQGVISAGDIAEGIVTIFVPGSTASITTIEAAEPERHRAGDGVKFTARRPGIGLLTPCSINSVGLSWIKLLSFWYRY